jgi:hypothetical protein
MTKVVRWYKVVLMNIHHYQSQVGRLIQEIEERQSRVANLGSKVSQHACSKTAFQFPSSIDNSGREADNATIKKFRGEIKWNSKKKKDGLPDNTIEDPEIRKFVIRAEYGVLAAQWGQSGTN